MARSSKKAAKAPKEAGRGGREARATSKKAAPAAAVEVEVVEEGRGLGIDDGIVLMTTVLLVIAFFFADYVLGTDYGKGLFFGG